MISLNKPFTPSTLRILRNALKSTSQNKNSSHAEAAVLIPFCNVEDHPGILLELRAKSLRSHSGEISFPGGRIDNTDISLIHGALRETQEELGINPAQVEILGEIGPSQRTFRGDMVVWPYVGFVHNLDEGTILDDESLPCLNMDTIRAQASPLEVATVIHLPLTCLVSPTRVRQSTFRNSLPYWTIDVTDLVRSALTDGIHTEEVRDEVGPGTGNRTEVWGLTGWYLSLLMKTLHLYQ